MKPYAPGWPERWDLGVWLAGLLLGLWALLSLVLLSAPLDRATDLVWAVPGALVLTHVYTGLFITAHDGMHGSISQRWPRLNRTLGGTCSMVHAMFPFDFLRRPHLLHHKHPGREGDPDFHDGKHCDPARWFLAFALRYLNLAQWLRLTIVFAVLYRILGIDMANILAFWAFPSMASTLQLFWFGTYLPHREPAGGYDNPHHAKSNDYGWLLSFFSCYHFGYHLEHHTYPTVPWWRLPTVRQKRLQSAPPAQTKRNARYAS